MDERWYCDCTTASAATCAGEDDFLDREPDGSCACGCHGTYSDDPENWQPLCLTDRKHLTDAEVADADDWLERIEAAEALIEEPRED